MICGHFKDTFRGKKSHLQEAKNLLLLYILYSLIAALADLWLIFRQTFNQATFTGGDVAAQRYKIVPTFVDHETEGCHETFQLGRCIVESILTPSGKFIPVSIKTGQYTPLTGGNILAIGVQFCFAAIGDILYQVVPSL